METGTVVLPLGVVNGDWNRGTGSSAGKLEPSSPPDVHVVWCILVLATMFQSQLVVPVW